jgi:hypothetical protein
LRVPLRRALALARKAATSPPPVVAARLRQEAVREVDRVYAPFRARALTERRLLRSLGANSIDEVWLRLLDRPYPFIPSDADLMRYDELCPADRARVAGAAEDVLAHEVDLLGSGRVSLGDTIDWQRDFKTDVRWHPRYGPRMQYVDATNTSDVKVPWELSRVQWVLPAAQAYLLTGDERFAAGVRDVLESWLAANPTPLGVNWAIAMEPALRILTWSWLFHALGRSRSWSCSAFRSAFLRSLYLHADFVERHFEAGTVNGNHFTADAAGLCFAGLVLGDGDRARRWHETGWNRLVHELPRQVPADGVDFEASSAYHRLVAELFALPAALRRAHHLPVPRTYAERLAAMGAFAAAYTAPDGRAPLWGDADDARALPLGGQPVNDHRYLPALLGAEPAGGDVSELFWLRGAEAAAAARRESPAHAQAFAIAGVYILREGRDYAFVDCGPVGLDGRGGHGHNDCLSFEAVLDGVRLVTDCGSYVYTADPSWRNRFRSTSFHNTPEIDEMEQARLDPDRLWQLGADAVPTMREWSVDGGRLAFEGSHAGYQRLGEPVTPVRRIALDPSAHALAITDRFEGRGDHAVAIPLHLASGVEAVVEGPGVIRLAAAGRRFELTWGAERDWEVTLGRAWYSPSYGVKHEIVRVCWRRQGVLRPLEVVIAPSREV